MKPIMQNKKELRRMMLSSRRSLSSNERNIYSQSITANLINSNIYKEAAHIMAYAAMPDEVQTNMLLEKILADGKTLCIPYITDLKQGLMQAAIIKNINDLVIGTSNILTVSDNNKHYLAPEKLNLIIVPGVAFTPDKYRLGMGGGFYDRFLPQAFNAVYAGVFFSLQQVKTLPLEATDVPLDIIFTENHIWE